MIGRATAGLERPPRAWLQALLGIPDVDARLKWHAVWPHLSRLPHNDVRLLDAGCGSSHWLAEIATRRPGWRLTGVDCSPRRLLEGQSLCGRLDLQNATLARADFLEYQADGEFDVVLSVCAAHYLAGAGKGTELFLRFASWIRVGGRILLMVPRRSADVRSFGFLRPVGKRTAFSSDELAGLCRASGLTVQTITGAVGPLGIWAKQIGWFASRKGRLLSAVLWPVRLMLAELDAKQRFPSQGGSLMLVALATKGPAVDHTA